MPIAWQKGKANLWIICSLTSVIDNHLIIIHVSVSKYICSRILVSPVLTR